MKLNEKQIEKANTAIDTIRQSEGATRAAINEVVPMLVDNVRSGGSVSYLNRVLAACSPLLRRKVAAFCKAFTGHEVLEDGHKRSVGKKLKSEKSHERISEDWNQFKASGQTVYGWIELSMDATAAPAEVTAETIRKDLGRVLKKSAKIEMTGDQLLAMLAEVVAADAPAPVAKAA